MRLVSCLAYVVPRHGELAPSVTSAPASSPGGRQLPRIRNRPYQSPAAPLSPRSAAISAPTGLSSSDTALGSGN